ncbi:MAG: HD domain-containing phosphohydrolase [Pseudomonadota bacterium]
MQKKPSYEALEQGNEKLTKEIAEQKQTIAALQESEKGYRAIAESAQKAEVAIHRARDIEASVNEVLRLSLEDITLEAFLKQTLSLILSIKWLALEAKGCIFLVEETPEALVMKVHSGFDHHILNSCARVPFGKCLCGRAALKKKTEFADRMDARHDISYEGILPHGHFCVPILYAGRVLGVINLYVKEGHHRAKQEDEFLSSIANAIAGVIQRKQSELELYNSLDSLRKAMGGAVQLLANISEARDPYTAGHQRRVADLSRCIATEMGLSKDQIEGIRMAGVIHDIGKISIPAEILTKPTRLTDIEFSFIKTHPQVAYDILKDIEFPWPVAQIVYQHHERINGSGYPQGLAGDNMLPEAKILSVADVVEAMASHRPYRPAIGLDRALEEILKNRGILYDPEVVDACLVLFQKKGFSFKTG